ncbi:hypothetical protein TWF481_002849 [Arthrobotrys musiformis]|uniref:Uncharacterized protein n=1 Tax=Arthrobotrys musiformis TaxID=47236 RepID=A0AAV9VRL2_9PEZI
MTLQPPTGLKYPLPQRPATTRQDGYRVTKYSQPKDRTHTTKRSWPCCLPDPPSNAVSIATSETASKKSRDTRQELNSLGHENVEALDTRYQAISSTPLAGDPAQNPLDPSYIDPHKCLLKEGHDILSQSARRCNGSANELPENFVHGNVASARESDGRREQTLGAPPTDASELKRGREMGKGIQIQKLTERDWGVKEVIGVTESHARVVWVDNVLPANMIADIATIFKGHEVKALEREGKVYRQVAWANTTEPLGNLENAQECLRTYFRNREEAGKPLYMSEQEFWALP